MVREGTLDRLVGSRRSRIIGHWVKKTKNERSEESVVSPEYNERSDESVAGTFGLHASSVKEERKRKKSCLTDAQLKRKKIDRKREKSSDEEREPSNYRTKKLRMSEVYSASGLKSSLHGVAYQLKLLMLVLKRAVDQGYPFRLATEMDAAEKFDDLVFQYVDGEKIVHRFLQAKHKLNEAEEISINDLLTDTGKELNLQKYFISYRKIKRNPEFNGRNNELKDFIICTNIGFKLDDKRGALTLSNDIFHTERDETILKTDLRRFKKDFDGREEIVSVLENATDLIKLAKQLSGCGLDNECTKKRKAKKETSDDILKSYRFPLEKEVIDGETKKLRRMFVKREGLSLEAENVWQAIEKVFHDQRKTHNLYTDPVIKREDLDKFARVVAELIQEGKDSKKIKIQKRKNVIKENFDKLAGYVLVKRAGQIMFSLAFLNNDKLPGNLDDFREKLLAELSKKNIPPNDIAKYIFEVYKGFRICDEIYVNMNVATFWKVIGEKEFDLFDNFSTRDANLESVDVFVKNLVHLIEKSRNNNELNVEIKKKNNKIFENMIKLAEYAKLIEENDGIRFSREFLEDTPLPGNLNEFRDQLKARVEDLGELRFVINNFPKTRLPSDSIADIDSEIDSFLDKLVFAFNQPNEIELDNIIDAKMGKCRNINLIHNDLLASHFQRYVFDWMKNKNGRFLTRDEGKDFFQEMARKLTTLQLTWTTREYSVHMQQINIRFTKDEMELRKFLEPKNTTQLFILMSMPNTILGLIQVHQILEMIPDYQKDDGYIFLSLNSFLRMQDPVVDAFASRSKRLLIIECKSIEVNEQASYRELEAMKFNNFGKIILITEKNGTPVDQFERIFKDRSVKKEVKVNSLLDLENESRKKIIKERIIKFQGQEVPLSTLMTNEESINLINAEALAKLINNETLEIGKCLEDSGDVGNYYIQRTLQRSVKINRSFSKDTLTFYVTTNNQLRDFDSQRHQDIVVISDNNELFKELSNNNNCKEHNIHWLKSENSQSIWQESKGTVSKLRNFVVSDNVESFSPEKVTDISNRIAIITAEPGMGKSTMLTHLSVQTKISEPTVWVAKINLSVDCSKKLEEMANGGINFDDETTIDFLLASAKFTSEMPEYRFLNYCYKTGNMILLFDGFDEICPCYNNKVIELLKFLKGRSVRNIWVTTRPYDIIKLEDELGSFSYVLKEFSKGDQRRFVREYWPAELNSDNFDKRRANSFIDKLLVSFSESINDCQRKFIGIPLQIRMIADVCMDTFKNLIESDEENIADLEKKLPENLELLSLYNNFFEVKFDRIRFREKQPHSDYANSDLINIIKKERERVVKEHEILALENLYPNNSLIPRKEVICLLKDIKQSDNKTGIIDRVVDDKPVFVHKSFAEYFVALWFSKNWQQENVKRLLKERIFSEESIVIQNFFDRMLASNELESSESQESSTKHSESANVYRLHNAVLNNDGSGVQKLLDDDESLIYKTDTAGRNLLHLAAARGHEGIARSFLEAVRKRAGHNVVPHPLSVEDKLFQWTPLAYADKCNHWNVAELFLETEAAGEDMFEAIKNIKKNDMAINWHSGYIGTSLHRAAREGYLKIAELLLKNGAIIDVRDGAGNTPLLSAVTEHYLCIRQKLKIVKYLVGERNARFEIENNSGRTAMHMAAGNGDLDVVKYLVGEKNAPFEIADKSGRTVLYVAAENRKLDIVKYLVDEKNARFEIADNSGCTVLHMAAKNGDLDLVKYLVGEKNAPFEIADKSERTVLYVAAENRKLDIVKYLVDEKNARFEIADNSGCTVLHMAAKNGDLDLVKYLAGEKNAPFEIADKSGRTVLYVAAENRKLDIVKYLVDEKNARFEIADNSGCTVLHMAAKNGDLDLVKYLVGEKNAPFEIADKSERTVLYVAAENRKLDIVKYLVDEKNARFEIADNSGCTVLHMAAKNGDLDLVKYLVDEKNADFEATDESGRTILHIAAAIGELEFVKYLVDEKNARFEIVDKLERTVLHMAAENGKLPVVKYLVGEKNANLEAADRFGRTALHCATSEGNWEIVEYLVYETNANVEAADRSGRTVLHMAAQNGNLELVKYLVNEKEANIEAVDSCGRTVLHFAALETNWDTVNYRRDKRSTNFNFFDSIIGFILYFVASLGFWKKCTEFFIGKNVDFETVDRSRRKVLHIFAKNEKLELVKYLVDEKNARFEIADNSGCTVLHMAAKNGDLDLVKYLVGEKNAPFEIADKSGRTALQIAEENKNSEIVEYLVNQKNANSAAING